VFENTVLSCGTFRPDKIHCFKATDLVYEKARRRCRDHDYWNVPPNRADYATQQAKENAPRAALHKVFKLNRSLLSVVLRLEKDSGRSPSVVESVPVLLAIGGIKCPRKAELRIGAEMTQVCRRKRAGTLEPHCRRNVVRTFVCLFSALSLLLLPSVSLDTHFLLFQTPIFDGLTNVKRSI